MVEYFTGKYFVWKLEGNVVTIQSLAPQHKKVTWSLEDFFDAKYLLPILEKWKKQGVTIVEFWVPPNCRDYAMPFFKANKVKMEVVRTERDGNLFCRLLL